jgi:hypothetical protein
MATNISGVTSHFPEAENGFTTTTSGAVASGATVVGLNSVAGYTNGEPAVFVIDPSDPVKKQTFTGIIDTAGNQVTNVVWTAGTNQGHLLGATVVDYATATHISMVSKGIKVSHNQDGTLKDSIVTTAKINDGAVTAVKVADGSITNVKLNTTIGELGGAWQDWTPTFGNFNLGNGLIRYAKYSQVGKTVNWRIFVSLGTTSSVTGSIQFSAPVPTASYVGADTVFHATGALIDAGIGYFIGFPRWRNSTTFEIGAIGAAGTYAGHSNTSATIPFTWGNGDIWTAAGTYEAA